MGASRDVLRARRDALEGAMSLAGGTEAEAGPGGGMNQNRTHLDLDVTGARPPRIIVTQGVQSAAITPAVFPYPFHSSLSSHAISNVAQRSEVVPTEVVD